MPADIDDLDALDNTKDDSIAGDSLETGLKSSSIPSSSDKKTSKETIDIKEEKPVQEVPPKDEKPKKFESVRDAIKDAREKASKKAESDNKSEDTELKKLEPNKEKAPVTKTVEDNKNPPKVEAPKFKAPVGWNKEAAKYYDTLPEIVKQAIDKREREAADGVKGTGETKKKLEAYDSVIDKLAPDIQNFGVTKPQFVERTLNWFNSLRHTDRTYALNSLKQLTQNFGFTESELQSAFAPKASTGNQIPVGDQQQANSNNAVVPQEVQSKISLLENEIANLKNIHVQNQDAQSKNFVDNWAKDKPHFDKVRPVMHALLSSGVIPLKEGQLDLDEAYERAVNSDRELSQQRIDEKLAEERAKNIDRQNTEAKRKADELANSRKANVSLRPTAPVAKPSSPSNVNGYRKESIKDSISRALKEVAGN